MHRTLSSPCGMVSQRKERAVRPTSSSMRFVSRYRSSTLTQSPEQFGKYRARLSLSPMAKAIPCTVQPTKEESVPNQKRHRVEFTAQKTVKALTDVSFRTKSGQPIE